MASPRDDILARIRRSIGQHQLPPSQGADSGERSRVWRRLAGQRGALIASLAQELEQVRGQVYRAENPQAARAYLKGILAAHTVRSALLWRHALLERLGVDEVLKEFHVASAGRELPEVIGADLGITASDYALADTGTLVLEARPGQGRLVSLLPPLHVAFLEAGRIVADLDDLFAVVPRPGQGQDWTSCLTFVTGPSRTADIELTLAVGVHGPRELHVIVLE